ncbi:MAG TPA: hypothetical protein ENI33_02640 [Thermoplasmatales archaeon]|nr:hypothetical protein [Thermoplasmatales archaeon]
MKKDRQDVVYKIFRLLRENAIKIIMAIREKERIRWKELQEITKLPTATFNRALSALQEVNFIKKDGHFYTLTWTGKLATDGLLLLGYRMEEEMEEVEDIVAEELLAKDITMAIILLLFVSLRRRGKLNIEKFEKEMKNEMKVIKEVFKGYEKEGYIEIMEGQIFAKDKIKEMDIGKLFQ